MLLLRHARHVANVARASEERRGVSVFTFPRVCPVSSVQCPGYVGPGVYRQSWPLDTPGRPGTTFFYPLAGHWSPYSGWWYVDWSQRRLVLNIRVLSQRCIRLPAKQSHSVRLGIAWGINNSFPGCSCDQNDFLWQLGIMINDPGLSRHHPGLSLVRSHNTGTSLVAVVATQGELMQPRPLSVACRPGLRWIMTYKYVECRSVQGWLMGSLN